MIFSGFSFRRSAGLRAACADSRVRATIGLGVPVAPVVADDGRAACLHYNSSQTCTKPRLFVAEPRQFGPRAKLERLVGRVPEPKKLILIEGGDHFFEGRLREVREAIESWAKEAVSSQPSALS